MRHLLTLFLCARMVVGAPIPSTSTPEAQSALGTPLSSVHLHNLFRLTTNILSGDSPESDTAFSEIAVMGVKTVVSVDGIQPQVATARKYGLRYIHLPFGYDGVPDRRVAELIRVARSAPGPIYVHCHHGVHRGPTAAALMCEATQGWTTNQAVAWLQQAGTSPEYPGLYRSASEFRPTAILDRSDAIDLPESSPVSSLVETMVAMDLAMDQLRAAQRLGWTQAANTGRPGLSAKTTATLLWERFRELARQEAMLTRPDRFRKKLSKALDSADELRRTLSDAHASTEVREVALRTLSERCASCHTQYRN